MGLSNGWMPREGERVKHIVMWNLLGSSVEEKAASVIAVKSRFERLRGIIPGMTHLEIGVDFSRSTTHAISFSTQNSRAARLLQRTQRTPHTCRFATSWKGYASRGTR
jgi:hypothetical protein